MLDEVIFSHKYFMIYIRRKKAGLCGLQMRVGGRADRKIQDL